MTVPLRPAAVLAGTAALALATATLTTAAPATAATTPTLSLSARTLSGTGASVVTVTGRRYLVPPHAEGADVFGGVYVFFGWVRPGGAWGPSHRSSASDAGTFAGTYAYPGDEGSAGTRDDADGAFRFVSFSAGGSSGASTANHMDDSGNWSVRVTVPGPTFRYVDTAGTTRTVDCRTVVCGLVTIGAHGKPSATNELFTPVTFAADKPSATPSSSTAPAPRKTASGAQPSSAAATRSPAPPRSAGAPSAGVTASASVPSGAAGSPPGAGVPRPGASTAEPVVVVAGDVPNSSGAGAWWLLAASAGAIVVGTIAARPRRRQRH